MRKIINDPDNFVDEVVDGILSAHPHVLKAVTSDRRALARADAPIPGHVGVVTGAGDKTVLDALIRRGRAAWLGERAQGHPDPGAVAYLRFLEALQDAVSRTNPLR